MTQVSVRLYFPDQTQLILVVGSPDALKLAVYPSDVAPSLISRSALIDDSAEDTRAVGHQPS